eukprot:403338573
MKTDINNFKLNQQSSEIINQITYLTEAQPMYDRQITSNQSKKRSNISLDQNTDQVTAKSIPSLTINTSQNNKHFENKKKSFSTLKQHEKQNMTVKPAHKKQSQSHDISQSSTNISTPQLQQIQSVLPKKISMGPQTPLSRLIINDKFNQTNSSMKSKLNQSIINGPQDLVNYEKLRLEAIIENEREQMKQAIEREIMLKDQQEEKELIKEKYQLQQQVRTRQFQELEELNNQKRLSNEQYLERKRKLELEEDEAQQTNHRQHLEYLKQKEDLRQRSSVKTMERKNKIFEKHMQKIGEKKEQLLYRDKSKDSFIKVQKKEKRAISTKRQQELQIKISEVLSKNESLVKERKDTKQLQIMQKDQKTDEIQTKYEEEQEHLRHKKSSKLKQRIEVTKKTNNIIETQKKDHFQKKIEDQEIKVIDLLKQIQKEKQQNLQQKNDVYHIRADIVEQVLKDQEQQRLEQKDKNQHKDTEFKNIIVQRDRIRDKIQEIKKKFEFERQTAFDQIKRSQSREQRNRLMIKLQTNIDLSYNGSYGGNRSIKSMQSSPVNHKIVSQYNNRNHGNQSFSRQGSQNSLFPQQ